MSAAKLRFTVEREPPCDVWAVKDRDVWAVKDRCSRMAAQIAGCLTVDTFDTREQARAYARILNAQELDYWGASGSIAKT